jgi:phage baseplate assembly protein W
MAISTAIYSDIDIELSMQTDGDITRDIEENAIINSLTNIINTMQGTRRMLPTFASTSQKLLFEPIDENTSNLIRNRLVDSIYRWEDRVIVDVLYINPYHDQNMYKCLLKFKIKDFPDQIGSISIRFVLRAI